MQLIKLLWRLSWKRRLLAIVIFVLLGIMRGVILLLPFRYYTKYLLVAKPSSKWQLSLAKQSQALLICKLVSAVAQTTPWSSQCLVQGLSCRWILRCLSIPSVFYIGVGKDEQNKLISHAWLNCAELTILGGAASFEKYKIISQFEDCQC